MPELSSIVLALAVSSFAALTGIGVLLLFRRDAEQSPAAASAAWLAGGSLLVISVITIAGFAIRAVDIERRGMTHVEVYVPGIDLPEDVSTPNPRIGLGSTLLWHYFREPHPPTYYVMSWFWTRALGTELWVLRLPSVLAGAAAILLVYLLALRVTDRRVATLSAVLLALNGLHVLYSEYARMYALGTFLALLSVMLWLRLLEQTSPRRKLEIAYVTVTTLALYTQTLLWVLLAAQMLYTLFTRCEERTPPRTFGLQLACVILGAPIVSQAILLSRPSPFEIGALAFLVDFLDFGFLFPPNEHAIGGWKDLPPLLEAALAALGTGLLFAGLRTPWPHARDPQAPSTRPVSTRALAAMAVGIAGLLIAFSTNHRVWQRNGAFAASAALPLLAAGIAVMLPKLQPLLRALSTALKRVSAPLPGLASPITIAALFPIALLLLLYPLVSLLVARGLLFSVPFLLIVIARGLVGPTELTNWRKALIGVVLVAHVGGWVYSRGFTSLVGYRELAAQIDAELQPGDLIVANYQDWGTTPIFYHLQNHYDVLVASDYVESIEALGGKRLWQIDVLGVETTAEMLPALCRFDELRTLEAQNIRAVLWIASENAGERDCDAPQEPAAEP